MIKEFMPYIVAVATALISGFWSYISATKKAKTDMNALQETGRLEIEKLMSQHKLDLAALERKHEMEKEKLEMEHAHKIELLQQEATNNMGSNAINSLLSEAMKTPEVKKLMSDSFKKKS